MRLRELSLFAPLFSLLLAFGVAFMTKSVAAAPLWVAPPAQQPGGNIAPSLNTSSQPQTKKGGLTIEGTVNIDPGKTLTLGRLNGTSGICWNGVCKSGWSDLTTTTGFLTLNQTGVPTDAGYIDLNQTGLGAGSATATVTGEAGVPETALPTYGVHGNATNSSFYSTGVYGQATVNSSAHFGIYATTVGLSSAWAGYFRGDVAVSDIPGTGVFDLVIGGGSAVGNGISEICLGGDCRSVWPASSGTELWTSSGGTSTLSPSSPPRSIAFAGAGPTAPLYVEVSGSGASSQANLTIRGSAQFDQFVVGEPSSPPPVSCGDGICTDPPENDVYCSPFPGCSSQTDYYCPLDCDNTPPGNAVPLGVVIGGRPCPPEGCPPAIFQVAWINPSDPDFFRTRLIIRTDRFPNGAKECLNGSNDGTSCTTNDQCTGGGTCNDPAGAFFWDDFSVATTIFNGSCSQESPYYAGLYAFDNKAMNQIKNVAPGAVFEPVCTNQGVAFELE